MRNKLFIAVCAALILSCLAGCRLAREPDAGATGRDSLIGAYLTARYLDLFDAEGYLSDNITGFSGGEIILSHADASKYNGRLYANVVYDDTGKISSIEFEGVEGVGIYAPYTIDSDGNRQYAVLSDKDAIEVDFKKTVADGTAYVLEGGVYVRSPGPWYVNPVFQTPDGNIYLSAGRGTRQNILNDGIAMSLHYSAEDSFTRNGRTITDSFKVETNIYGRFPPEKVSVFEMGAEGETVKVTELDIKRLPGSISPAAETEYLIIETEYTDSEGLSGKRRAFYDRSDTEFPFYLPDNSGLYSLTPVALLWD